MTRFTASRLGQHATAIAFALATTLAMLSGVDRLATPSPAGALLVQAASAPAQG